MNFWTIVIAIGAAFAGYKLNQRANEQSEKRIIEALTAEIEQLKIQQSGQRSTGTEQAQIEAYKKAIDLLKKK